MAIIKSPNKSYTGVSAGVAFANGEGKTDDKHLKEWFFSKGYTVVEEHNADILSDGPKNLEDMKKEDLIKIAEKFEVEFNSKTTKEELIIMIKDKQEGKIND